MASKKSSKTIQCRNFTSNNCPFTEKKCFFGHFIIEAPNVCLEVKSLKKEPEAKMQDLCTIEENVNEEIDVGHDAFKMVLIDVYKKTLHGRRFPIYPPEDVSEMKNFEDAFYLVFGRNFNEEISIDDHLEELANLIISSY